MRISAAGSKTWRSATHRIAAAGRLAGFTLLELLVVVAIVAIASAGVALALRDSSQTQLEREAQRLAALLESARAQSRTLGVAVVWRSQARGFVFEGLPAKALPSQWLDASTQVASGSVLVLGPEPIIAAQSVTLHSQQSTDLAWQVATDGLHPFALRALQADANAARSASVPPSQAAMP